PNPKSRTHRRQRNPAQDDDTAVEDHELTSYLAALAREPDEHPESTGSGRRFGDGLVYQVRVNDIAGQQLKELAAQRNTSPQALAREWVLERLSWESRSLNEETSSENVPQSANHA